LSERAFIRRVLIVLGLAALAFLLWQLRIVLVMLFGAVVIATIFRALADIIRKRLKLPDALAVGTSVLLILGTVVGLAAIFGSQVSQQVETLGEALPKAWQSLERRVGEMGLGEALRNASLGGGSLSGFGRTLMAIGGGLADFVVVLFAGVFLAAQPNFYRAGAIKLVPSGKRALVAEAMIESERALRMWLKGQLIAMVMVGLLTGAGLFFLGVPSALVLGILAGLLEFVPFAGPLIAAIPALLLALAVSPDMALWVAVLYFVVQQLEGAVLQPMIQQYAVDLPGVVLLFALIAFGTLFGALGVILAAPLGVVTYVLVKRLYVIEALDTKTPLPGDAKT
jgi:predicted PurR-regulated permease PerM